MAIQQPWNNTICSCHPPVQVDDNIDRDPPDAYYDAEGRFHDGSEDSRGEGDELRRFHWLRT